MTNLDIILKSRDITLPTKACLVKAMAFPVVMYGCESWTMKKAEGRRIDAFELWCWRRLLRVPSTARRSNQSTLKETTLNIRWKDWCWSWSSNALATWCEELTHWKRPRCLERLRAGGEGGDRGWDGWMASLTQWTCVWASSGRQWRTRKPGTLQSRGSQRVRHDLATEQQQSYKHKEPDSATIMGAWRKAQKSRWECSCSQYLDFSQERFWAKNSVRSHRTSDL